LAEEVSREELLDNTPEAVAMRAARAKRAEAARLTAEAPKSRPNRRRWVVGAVLGLATVAGLASQLGR
jgi:hypothetical protein